jgi:hypothetical protein
MLSVISKAFLSLKEYLKNVHIVFITGVYCRKIIERGLNVVSFLFFCEIYIHIDINIYTDI